MGFEILTGKIITDVDVRDDEIIFVISTGEKFKMYHEQECYEDVYISDIVGDWGDILHHTIKSAQESTGNILDACESGTWTFYRIFTSRGDISIRWNGESNGYYSESVDFIHI